MEARWLHALETFKEKWSRTEARLEALEAKMTAMNLRVAALEPRVERDVSQSEVRVPVASLGVVYTESPFLQSIFSDEGSITYNGTDGERAAGFARGLFPEGDLEKGFPEDNLLLIAGDDIGERDLDIYSKGLFALAQRKAQGLEVPSCFFTRAGREKATQELWEEAQLCTNATLVIDRCVGTSLGYCSFLQLCLHLAHGRQVYLIDRPERKLAQFDGDKQQVNFVGPRESFTERQRQDEIESMLQTLLEPYCRQTAPVGPKRVTKSVEAFFKDVLFAFPEKVTQRAPNVDAGYIAAWLRACPEPQSDITRIARAIMTCILHTRGMPQENLPEQQRILFEAHNNPYTRNSSPRDVELKHAFEQTIYLSEPLCKLLAIFPQPPPPPDA